MKTPSYQPLLSSRRELLKQSSMGFGWLAFAALNNWAKASESFSGSIAVRKPHFQPKAKRVIFLFMRGGPSHLDTCDWKPELAAAHGTDSADGKLLGPQFSFTPRGDSGLMMSDLFPHLGKHADDLCLLNGMHTSNAAHNPATGMMHTGSVNFIRPSMGSWVVYGLGTENENLPGFLTINPNVAGGAQNYGSAFLPASYQGTRIDSSGAGIPNLQNASLSAARQRQQVDLVQAMNRELFEEHPGNTELEGVIESYELAYRMQKEVPRIIDLSGESRESKERYGLGRNVRSSSFAAQCLMARRLAEQGVRFIQVSHTGWDTHSNLQGALTRNARNTDQAIAALLQDLKDRDMLKDTLVVWGGEFGRSPQQESSDSYGRRHNHRGFSMWMAGGGVKGGMRYGATDELGGTVVSGRMSIHDLHATILHLLGLDHEKLTYRYAGRDFRLTDVYGEVAEEIVL
ncbi:MAG: DUF1501 domain-containing protein [Verrucomicrobiota bacterium]